MKKIMAFVLFFVVLISSAIAQEEHDFAQAKQIINSGVSCSELTDEQLEEIGDYYMEQMHPGEAHEIMDNMMGGEGSESLKQVHIKMARRIYCNENGSGGMMGIMDGGMMGNYSASYNYRYWDYVWMLILTVLVIAIGWLIYKFGIKKPIETPLGIIKKRFAKGEITKKQFDDMRKELEE